MQLEFFDVPSPCVSVCQSNDKGFCRGCMRSRDERLDWKTFDNDNKQKIIKRCIQRKKRQDNKLKKDALESQTNHQQNGVALDGLEENPHEFVQPSLLDSPVKAKKQTSDDLDFGDFEL